MAMTRDQPELTQRPLTRLTPQLGAQRLFGALPLRFDLRALHLEPGAVAVERLLERGDQHARQPRLERPERPRRSAAAGPISPPTPGDGSAR